MATITIVRTTLLGDVEHLDIWIARPTRDWEIPDAKAFLHAMQTKSATTDCPLQYVDCIRLHESCRPNLVAIEVVTNAGIVMSEPIRVSGLAMAWLDEVQFDSRPYMATAARPQKRMKPSRVH